MAKVSVIVPVYNTGKYVEKCLDSLINQTVKNELEIIIVNDGSTDNSEEIIKKYMKKQDNQGKIKYYAKENEGIAKTRNLGIEKATSEYIMFVDSDDYIDTELIERLKPYIDKQMDLIKFKLQRVDEKKKIIEKVSGPTFENMTGEEAFNIMFSEDVLIDSPCVYLIKKELFTKYNLKFQQTYHEDFGLIPIIILVAKNVVSTPYYLYQYVQSSNSITRNADYTKIKKRMDEVLIHYDNMLETIQNINLNKRTKENVKIYYTNAIILKLKDLKEEDKDKYIKEIKKRKMYDNIKVRNLKQLLKKILLRINVKLYLKMR
jgi:glycosyltransferase involved in cell wall biosynthesis